MSVDWVAGWRGIRTQQFFLGFGLGFGFVRQWRGGAGFADQLRGQIIPAVGGEHGAVQLVV